jgi:cytochrome c peroxidase
MRVTLWRRRLLRLTTATVLLASSLACNHPPPAAAPGMSRADARRRALALRDLGAKIFADTSLSASGMLSCASCHVPSHAFGPAGAQAVELGGPSGASPGARAVPSLRYLHAVPPFTRHFFASDGDESFDNGPTGGLTWDGRVDRARDQAKIPLLSPIEMANASESAIVDKLRAAPYARELQVLAAGEADLATALEALEAFQEDPARFSPYSSRYDEVLRGAAMLSLDEQRGLALFNDPKKGNCTSCHPSERGTNGTPPAFSDFALVALGVPRNAEIPANADAAYLDLGLCGPARTDLVAKPDYCGLFRTPSLRNVAVRQTFFHNGVIHSLREAVAFYATRDTDPARWYGRAANGEPRKFTDLPEIYWRNVETGPPFGRRRGETSALSDADIDAIVAFLKTLTDADILPGR